MTTGEVRCPGKIIESLMAKDLTDSYKHLQLVVFLDLRRHSAVMLNLQR